VDDERFARITYETMLDPTDKTDRKGKQFALAKIQVVRAWLGTPRDQRIGGPEAAEEAEKLSREDCDILENIPRCSGFENPMNTCLLISYCLLVSVMKERGKENSDTEKVLLKALSSTKECRVGEVPRVESSRNRYKLLLALAEQYLVLGFDAPDNCLNIGYLNKANIYVKWQ
jgi:hypothetical protein